MDRQIGYARCKCGKHIAGSQVKASLWQCSCGERVPIEVYIPMKRLYQFVGRIEHAVQMAVGGEEDQL